MAKVRRKGANVRKDILAITNAIVQNADRIRIATFNTVKGQMARRIFNNGISTNGSDIGQYKSSSSATRNTTNLGSLLSGLNYKASYKAFRNSIGRRIDKVDLQLTGTLMKALQVGISEERSVIGILGTPEPEVKATSTIQAKQTNITNLGSLLVSTSAATKKKQAAKLRARRSKASGGTGSRRLVITGTSDFNADENAIALEKHFKKEIFAPSKEEIDRGEVTVKKEINLVVKKALG